MTTIRLATDGFLRFATLLDRADILAQFPTDTGAFLAVIFHKTESHGFAAERLLFSSRAAADFINLVRHAIDIRMEEGGKLARPRPIGSVARTSNLGPVHIAAAPKGVELTACTPLGDTTILLGADEAAHVARTAVRLIQDYEAQTPRERTMRVLALGFIK